jgi:hypothetical protein
MELMLANYQFARLGEWNICTAVGRLFLPKGEGKVRVYSAHVGSVQASNPSPQSSPLVARGEAGRATRHLVAERTRMSLPRTE